MLQFVPLGKSLVPLPGTQETEGQAPRRVCARVVRGEWTWSSTPHSVDPQSRDAIGLIRMAQRGDLAPADEATAAACGLQFKPVAFVDGAWKHDSPSPARRAAKE